MAKIDGLFKIMFDRGASDLHLISGQAPILRLQGALERIEGHGVLEHDYLREILYEITRHQGTGWFTGRGPDGWGSMSL